jgi:uncharacterized protein
LQAPYLKKHKLGVIIELYVQPRASRTELVGTHGDCLKIRIQSPPVDDAANEEIIEFFATVFLCPTKCITMVKGHTNRKKTILVTGINEKIAQEKTAT